MKRRDAFDEREFQPRKAETLDGFGLGRLPAGSQPVSTSEAAAEINNLAERREKVLLWFASRGTRGGTADELEEAFGLGHNNTSPRVCELVTMGFLVRTEIKRRTRQGKSAFVHITTERGKQVIAKSA